jgi:RNA polymerase sigma-70 factor (ECF subfamily)
MAGDGDALVEILHRHGPLVYGLARRITQSPQLAEDVAQEVFVALWRRPDRFDPGRGSLRAFLAVQAQRRAVDIVRSETRRSQREARSRDRDQPVGERSPAPRPEDELERSAVATSVRQAMTKLPPEQRIVVELAYFGGRTHREIAAELGIPEGTMKSRMRLAHIKLKPLLDGQLLRSAP